MKISAGTDKGNVRSSNQDCFAYGELPDGVWAVVCDGMGGHAGGNVASTLAAGRLEEIITRSYREGMSSASLKNVLESAFVNANISVYDKACAQAELSGMGTTAVAVIVNASGALVANAGDSRCYLLRGDALVQITEDHSLVQHLVNNGIITPEQALEHPQKNIITNALGLYEDVRIDITECAFSPGDRLLLCSDGLSNEVSGQEMLALTGDGKAEEYADRLIEAAKAHGGRDNITAVVLEG